jgi:hypothetical protein
MAFDFKQLWTKDMDKIEFSGYEATIDLTVFLPTTDTRPTNAAQMAESRSA